LRHSFDPSSTGDNKYWEDLIMAWKAPKVLEISIGMEINSYACAELY
jgi:coenzyme PQQ precursor peptide PqqA